MTAFDLSSITAPTEATVDRHELRIRPGQTEYGRYWQLTTLDGVPVGMVAEHTVKFEGRIVTVFEASSPSGLQRGAMTANAAARLVVRALARGTR